MTQRVCRHPHRADEALLQTWFRGRNLHAGLLPAHRRENPRFCCFALPRTAKTTP